MTGKPVFLFLCTQNSARSQIAEALLRHHSAGEAEAHSAGIEPGPGIHPLARKVLEERGVSMTGQQAKSISQYLGKLHVHHLVTVCDGAAARCPKAWPGVLSQEHWSIRDPAACSGTEAEQLEQFRHVRDELHRRVVDYWRKRTTTPQHQAQSGTNS